MTVILIFAGLALLLTGGELLVRGAVSLAAKLGLSPLVIGLTVVGFGTSTPELVTSVQGAMAGTPGIAIGNIVGSNIANILLILAVSAIVSPIAVGASALKRDATVMLVVALVFAVLASLLPLGRLLGLGYLGLLAIYIMLAIRTERSHLAEPGALREKAAALEESDPGLRPEPAAITPVPAIGAFGIVMAGLALLIVGGRLLVSGAIGLAQQLEIAETVIGLTIVAIGTSLPELITSLVAALRRHGDIAFGNIIGSNIYNILGIGGVTALIAPVSVPGQIIAFDNPVMVLASLLLVAAAWTGLRITRIEGAMLLAGYALYVFLIWP